MPRIVLLIAVLWPFARTAAAQESTPWRPELLGAQFTAIGQRLAPLHSPYAGRNSLRAGGDAALTHTYGLYGGMALSRTMAAYLDVEMARGSGVSDATGLAGVTNGDVIRQGAVGLSRWPVMARAFLRWTLPLSSELAFAERGMDQLPGDVPASRLEISAGRLAASDLFDVNRYANNTRTQFLNWVLINNGAWDYAADTRGYSIGASVAWITPRAAVRLGSFMMPRRANGPDLDGDVGRARGDNIEITLFPGSAGTVLRFLAYLNHARMGSYAEAIAATQPTFGAGAGGTTVIVPPPYLVPDIVADDRPGRFKYGFGLNVEQPIADSGETGAFLRAGWNDGRTESFAFTEVDAGFSVGLQVCGARWGRAGDRLGFAVAVDYLSRPHRDYLAAAGVGFLLGDGQLSYGAERVLEAYYRLQLGRFVQAGPDFQYVRNPGYNRDRGPASVFSLRVRAAY